MTIEYIGMGNDDGTTLGLSATDKISFYGATAVVQRSGGAQVALTDSTTGTAGDTLAAGAGVATIAIPIQLAAMTTAAADLITAYVPGYKFKLLALSFVTTKVGTGTSASQVLNLEIGTTNVTGGVLTVVLADTDVLGEKVDATAITAANTGSATDTISLEVAASGTVFTAGDGILLLKIQNMDTADAVASAAAKTNELRAALVALGAITGAA